MRPDHKIHARHKNAMKAKVIGILLFAASAFFFFLFPDSAVDLLLQTEERWLKITAKGTGTAALAPILSFILFASDSAFKGDSRTAAWVRGLYASRAAATDLKCTPKEADALWFRYFDTWALPKSDNLNLLQNSYAATYTARMVFYLQRATVVFILLGGVSMAIDHWLFGAYSGATGNQALVVDGSVLGSFVAAFAFLALTNRPGHRGTATGCWHRVEDVFGRSEVVFRRDVLSRATSVDEAFQRIEKIRDRAGAPRSGT